MPFHLASRSKNCGRLKDLKLNVARATHSRRSGGIRGSRLARQNAQNRLGFRGQHQTSAARDMHYCGVAHPRCIRDVAVLGPIRMAHSNSYGPIPHSASNSTGTRLRCLTPRDRSCSAVARHTIRSIRLGFCNWARLGERTVCLVGSFVRISPASGATDVASAQLYSLPIQPWPKQVRSQTLYLKWCHQ